MLRFAYKLARGNARWRSGHHALEELSPQELAHWYAAYRLDPWGDDWERSSMIAAELINVVRCLAPGAEIDADDLLPPDAFVPFRKHKSKLESLAEEAAAGLEGIKGL